MTNSSEQIQPVASAAVTGPRSIRDIIADLSRPVAQRHLKTRRQGGTEITYIEWHTAVRYLNLFAPGWSYHVKSVAMVGNLVTVIASISIPCLEGVITLNSQSDKTGGQWAVSTRGQGRQKRGKSASKSTTKKAAKRRLPKARKSKARPPVPNGFEARPRDNRWQLFRLHGKKLSDDPSLTFAGSMLTVIAGATRLLV
jgi:hypothetical protein